jgi:seryl-tRNA synthetase
MSNEFQENIKNWVSLDNKIKKMQKEVKEIRNMKNELTDHIFTYAEHNNLGNAGYEKIIDSTKNLHKLEKLNLYFIYCEI